VVSYISLIDLFLKENEMKNTNNEIVIPKPQETTFNYQMNQICRRGLINIQRDKMLFIGRFFTAIFMGLLIGGIYFDVGTRGTS